MILSQKDVNRFWSKVEKRGPNQCWPWLAGKTKANHGVFSIKHKWVLAHRISFFIKNGYLPDIKDGKLVMHDCENAECQNPKHLIEGDNIKNQNYPRCLLKHKSRAGPLSPMWGKRGKNSPRYGLKHSKETKAKISQAALVRGGWHKGLKRTNKTKEKISVATRGVNNGHSILNDEIVRHILKSSEKNITLAKLYGVDPSIISSIRRRTRWKHVSI